MSVDATVLADLARARRSRRLAGVDIFEKLYQAYLTVISVGMALLVGASLVGDEAISDRTLARVIEEGPAVVGVLAALVLAVGLRSGLRGGPLTLEPPFVAHVLLSPVPRDRALRAPAVRQLGQLALHGGALGAMAGVLAGHRIPTASVPLVLFAALAAASLAVAAGGAAMVVAGWPLPRPVVHLLSLALLAGAVGDVVAGTAWSPGALVGRLALSGPGYDAVGWVVPVAAGLLATAGVALVGGTSIESSRRRAGLISQLRFAVTRQDLRTVVLLQRRLAQDAARARPWVRIPAGGRLPVLRRGFQGLARLPLARLLRVLALTSTAVAAGVGTWRGTTPLVIVAGVALWAAALDLIEPLAQELDHPDRWAGYPVGHGDLLLRHLVAPGLLLLAFAAVPVAALAVATDRPEVLQAALPLLVPACAAAVLGSAAAVAMGPLDVSSMNSAMPEAIGTQMVVRTALPPALPVLATLPLLAARAAHLDGFAVAPAATQYLLPTTVLLGAAGVWLARRSPKRI